MFGTVLIARLGRAGAQQQLSRVQGVFVAAFSPFHVSGSWIFCLFVFLQFLSSPLPRRLRKNPMARASC